MDPYTQWVPALEMMHPMIPEEQNYRPSRYPWTNLWRQMNLWLLISSEYRTAHFLLRYRHIQLLHCNNSRHYQTIFNKSEYIYKFKELVRLVGRLTCDHAHRLLRIFLLNCNHWAYSSRHYLEFYWKYSTFLLQGINGGQTRHQDNSRMNRIRVSHYKPESKHQLTILEFRCETLSSRVWIIKPDRDHQMGS